MTILTDTNATIATIFIIIGVAVVLGVLSFVLYKFVFSRTLAKKHLKEVQRKYSYLSGLLLGTDGQYIHRLESVSRTNILYIDVYETFTKRFKDIHEVDDKFAQNKIKHVESLINSGHYKNINIYLDEAKKAVNIFEEQVNKLHHDLYQVIKPEEEARKTIHELKENYRVVKQAFYVSQQDLELSTPSFMKTFDKLEQCFLDFETYIDSAKYEEANALIPVISKVISALAEVLEKLPNLSALVVSIIPEKLATLTSNYVELENNDYPLWHLGFKTKKEEWNYLLDSCKAKIINLQTNGVLDTCNKIQIEIEAFQESLELEISSKNEFVEKNQEMYHNVNELSKAFLNVCSLLPEIRSIYKIEPQEEAKITQLKIYIDDLDRSKRSLDVFIHSNTKQPYSILKTKLNDLEKDYLLANEGVNEFKAYVVSLRQSAENAYNLIYDYFYRLKSCEEILRNINIKSFSDLYTATIDSIYERLNEIYDLINIKPIDVNLINERVEQLTNEANVVFDEIDNKSRECRLAESMILYCNRDRSHQTDVNYQLVNLEERFFNGEFENVYHEATAIFKRTHIEDHSSNGRK